MTERDIQATADAAREIVRKKMVRVGPKGSDKDDVVLVEAAGELLTGALVDLNRIANALETISKTYDRLSRRPGG